MTTQHAAPAKPRALQHALAAQAHGYAAIPINRFKAPAIRSAHPEGDPRRGRCHGECGQPGHGVHDATNDPERLADLFAAATRPTGYAVACGREPHRLVGIDLDVKNGDDGIANFEEIARRLQFAIPDTLTVATPSGGRHLWLAAPRNVTIGNSVGKLAPGIDVRGSGGMLAGPGSWTPAGTYTLLTAADTPIADAPEPLLALMRRAPVPRPRSGFADAAGRVTGRINALVITVKSAGQGERNNTLYWAGCRMAEAIAEGHLSEDEGHTLLIAAAQSIGLDYGEADSAISSAFRTARR